MTLSLTPKSLVHLLLTTYLLIQASVSLAVEFSNGPEPSMLIELYTSEGCSSCPPAEHYINQLQQHEALWKQVFPVVFHVDYWNNLGWVDRFSRPEYSQRQRYYARYYQRRSVYTPAFYINGSSWRPGWFNKPLPKISTDNTGILHIDAQSPTVTAHYTPALASDQTFNLHLAVLGMDLKTDIHTGENTGRTAEHQFVVLYYQQQTSSDNTWQMSLPALNTLETRELALIGWISENDNPTPIQVTGGILQSTERQVVNK